MIEQLDKILENKKKSEKIILFLLPILVFFSLSYTYLFPLSEESLQNSKSTLNRVENEINIQKIYLNSINIRDIDNIDKNITIEIRERYNRDIAKIKEEIESINTEREYINSKLLEFMDNQNKWSDFLNYVANRAKELKLHIYYIENEKLENSSLNKSDVFRDLNIKVNGSGSFQNVLRYVNDIENFGVFVELNSTKLKVEDVNITFTLDINNWRVKL